MTAATGRTGVAWPAGPGGGPPAPAGTGDNPVRMDAETSDEMLMLAYARGDVDAFPVLYRRHRNRLYGFLLRSLGQRDQADEAAPAGEYLALRVEVTHSSVSPALVSGDED